METAKKTWRCPGCGRNYRVPASAMNLRLCRECEAVEEDDELRLPEPPAVLESRDKSEARTPSSVAPQKGSLLLEVGRVVAEVMIALSMLGAILGLVWFASAIGGGSEDTIMVSGMFLSGCFSSFGLWVIVLAVVRIEGHARGRANRSN